MMKIGESGNYQNGKYPKEEMLRHASLGVL